MKYAELIKKSIVITITVIVTFTILWFATGLLMKNSIKEVPLKEQQIKQEFRE